MLEIIIALLAGVLTIAAPCILPLLPFLLGASIGRTGTMRPLLIAGGFVVGFSIVSIILVSIIQRFGIQPSALRTVAIIFLMFFAVFLIFPDPLERFMARFTHLFTRAGQIGQGNAFLLGLMLGIVWTPCAGPVLGSILTLIATQGETSRSFILLLAYTLGAGIPMIIIGYASQLLTTRIQKIARYAQLLQKAFGVLILLFALAMLFQYDTIIEQWLTSSLPTANIESLLLKKNTLAPTQPAKTQKQSVSSDLSDYGNAPDFTGATHWLNSPPLTKNAIKGKVVLVDFWTYSCINCIRTIPFVTHWYERYKNQGFVVIGVHTPEFAFEKDTNNVARAIKEMGITYPIAQDNNSLIWQSYNNEYWPAEYLIDKNGEIAYEHFGEGNYDHTENAIRAALGMSANAHAQTGGPSDQIESPEIYFGIDRLANLDPRQQPSSTPQNYVSPPGVALNTFALEGMWQFSPDHITATESNAHIHLHFSSGKLYMVAASSNAPVTVKISVDGVAQKEVTVQASKLYTLFDSNQYTDHTADIEILSPGLEAFTFTFG